MRKTDTTTADYPRSKDRIFATGGEWFVRTREGDRGRFRTRGHADAEQLLYVETMSYLAEFGGRVPEAFDPNDVIVVDMDAPAWR